MRRVYTLLLMFVTALATYAAPTITNSGDTLVITVKAAGDLNNSNFTDDHRNATNVKIVTANGVKISESEWFSFFGGEYQTPAFNKIKDLNLALAEFANDQVIRNLGQNSKFLNNGGQLGELVFPESITSTVANFNNADSKWTSIVFPNATKDTNKSSTAITGNMFQNNPYVQKVTIGTSVKSIGSMAFNQCANLEEVEYLYGLTRVSGQAFYGNPKLTTVILPESVTEIGGGAFENCVNLTTLRLPNSLKTIGQAAFASTGLTSVVIPASVEHIATNAFGNIKGLTDVYVLGENTKAALQAFQPTSYTYGYSYSGPGQGETVKITDFTSSTGYYTVLHYPTAAYEKYVNRYIRVLGTDQYASSGYSQYSNLWVVDADGTKYPVRDDGNFTSPSGDYAGWNEFMLTGKLKDTYKDERLVEGKWYSVCFPFDVTEKEIKNAFGSATEVCEFSGVEVKDDEQSTTPGKKYITLNFKKEVKEMKAHHPYMIHPGLHGASYNMIMDVAIDTDTDGDNFASKLKAESVSYTVDGVTYTFIGNHTAGAKVPMYSYYYYSGDNTKWANAFYKAMRTDVVFTPHTAVVTLSKDNGVSSGAAKQNYVMRGFRMLDDNIVTAIDNLPTATATTTAAQRAANVYSIYGQVVRQGSTSLEGLPAGIYVVNGKKYVVK